ncbi:unnamed protein product, partial [Prorocentrum cordatum]
LILISLAAHMLKVEAGRRRTTQAGQPQRLCSGLFLRATCQQKAIGHPEKKVAAGGLWTGTAKKRAASEQGRQAKHATKAFRNLRRLRCRFMIAALRTSDRPRHSLSATAARDSGKMPTRGVQHTLPCRKLCRLMALSSKT